MAASHRSEAAYAGLLSALLDAREDVAGARFDAVLGAAESQGQVSGVLARELRYWQRAAARAVAEHMRVTVPRTLATLEGAAAQAVVDVEDAADAWRRASDPQRGEPAPSSAPAAHRPGRHEPRSAATPVPEGPALVDVSDAGEGPTDLLEHRRRALVAGLLNANGDPAPRTAPR